MSFGKAVVVKGNAIAAQLQQSAYLHYQRRSENRGLGERVSGLGYCCVTVLPLHPQGRRSPIIKSGG